jgi:hypothetical protein
MIQSPTTDPEYERFLDLLRKVFEQTPHSDTCRWRRTSPVAPEWELCDCYRSELANALGLWPPRSH